jgi:RNA polymerase sigma factor (TIGR02999 family)
MTAPDRTQITALLRSAHDDGGSALRELVPVVHDELRRIARAQMRNERRDHTLDPTALVHEAFVRLVDSQGLEWQDRAEFLALAAVAMRRVLIDHARAKRTAKRGGDRTRVALEQPLAADDTRGVDVLDLHEKLEKFRGLHERRAKLVELRFFGGMTFEEMGHVLGLSPRTVEDDWYFARAWLRRELRAGRAGDGS